MKNFGVPLITLAALLASSQLQAESLRDIYELALENDAQLKSETAQYRAALESENINRAALLPQINANYAYTDSDTDSTGESVNVDSDSGQITTNANSTNTDVVTDGYQVTLSQTLFNLNSWFSFQSGKELTKQAEANFAGHQQNLIVRTVEAYFAVLRAQDNLAASQAQERAFERQLEQTQQRFDVGLIAITDVHEAQAAKDLAEVTRITDENNVAVALEQLSTLTGTSHSNLDLLEEDFEVVLPQPNDRAEWVDFALQNNFSLQAARYHEQFAHQNAKAQYSNHLPTVGASVSYSDRDTEGDITIKPESPFTTSPDGSNENTTWEIRLDVPLFSGGATSARRRRAAEEFNQAREDRINLDRTTISNTRALHMTVVSDVSRVRARKQSIVSSQSALDATQAGYEVGTRNVVDVLNAQNSLFAAQRDYANSRYDYIQNMVQLKELAGLLSPEDIYKLDSFLEPAPAPTASSTTAP